MGTEVDDDFWDECSTPPPTIELGHTEFSCESLVDKGGQHDIVNRLIRRIRQESDAWKEWAILEILHWRERCYELEVQLLEEKESFPQIDRSLLNPKKYRLRL